MLHENVITSAKEDADLSPRDFALVSRLAYDHSGIVLPDNKRVLVASRLAKLVRERRTSLSAFVGEATQNPKTLQALIEALTTNHTRFFRENHHFTHFADHVRPHIMTSIDRKRPVRLWSAGSSSGEEVHSLAMTLLGENRGEASHIRQSDLAILATDINHDVLKIGREGLYDTSARNEIPPAFAKLWVRDAGRQIKMADDLRQLIRFRHLNLIGDWPVRAEFDAIFCRNTMIYFDAATTEKLQCRLIAHLRPGGHLYIGHSERLMGKAAAMVANVGQTIFEKAAA